MFKPAPMKQVNVLVLREDIDAVTENIADAGVMHVAECGELEDWAGGLSSVGVEETLSRATALEKKIRGLAREMGMGELPRTISSSRQYLTLKDLEDAEARAASIEADVSALLVERDSKAQELAKLRAISAELATFAPLGRLDTAARYSFLEVRTGKVLRDNMPLLEGGLAGVPHVVMPLAVEGDAVTIVAICLKKDRAALEAALRQAAFEAVPLPPGAGEASARLRETMAEKSAAARRALDAVEDEISAARRSAGPAMIELIERVNCTKLLARARGRFRRTESACLISGWVPEDWVTRFIGAVKEATGGRCYIEVRSPGDVPGVKEGRAKVPVLFRNPFFARPFEILTSGYGIPSYGAIDPTVFVAVTFLIMFGVMFGDIGEGLVLMLLGTVLTRRLKAQLMKLGALVFYCGFSSLVFGVLYGSFFGVERWLRPVWVRPMSDVIFFLKTALVFGISVVSLGIVINIINALRARDWVRGIFDKAGLLAGVIYWGAIGLAVNAFLRGERRVRPAAVLLVVGVPVALLFMRAPFARLAGKSAKLFPEGPLVYFAERTVECVEIFISFLSNTLSFIRVAAFAIAHAMLFLAVFSLADVVRSVRGGTLLSAGVIVLGNVLIIMLEGLIVAIQAVRLEYYEFFGKFFSADGAKYKPVKIVED